CGCRSETSNQAARRSWKSTAIPTSSPPRRLSSRICLSLPLLNATCIGSSEDDTNPCAERGRRLVLADLSRDEALSAPLDSAVNCRTATVVARGNRLLADGTSSPDTTTIYSYDAEGNVTRIRTAAGQWVFRYDHANQLVEHAYLSPTRVVLQHVRYGY